MKTIKIITINLIIGLMISCSSSKYIPSNGEIDNKFIGIWEGVDIDNNQNIKISWDQTRKKNGTYQINFKKEQGGTTTNTTEKGYWWVIDDKFFEINPKQMEIPDIYRFEFLNEDEIKFILLKADQTSNKYSEVYTFIDKRKK